MSTLGRNTIRGTLALALTLTAFPMISRGASITLQGTFTADDNVQLFYMSLAAPAAVDIRSFGYAGGTTSASINVPAGGFDTILTLFDSTGLFITDNDDGGAGVGVDPLTGQAADARIVANLGAGTYTVALTQYDNFSIGDLADGFGESGRPNFTADPSFASGGSCPGDMFRDISGTAGRCRTGNWTLDFVNVDSAVAAPEPAALLLAGAGLLVILLVRARKAKVTIATVGLSGAILHAQTGPDYSGVSDFLNGKRTLLEITDLMVVGVGAAPNPTTQDQLFYSGIQTANSQQTNPATLGNTGSIGTNLGRPLAMPARLWNTPAPLTLVFLDAFIAVRGLPDRQYVVSNGGSHTSAAAVGDFNRDGFDEFVFCREDGSIRFGLPPDVNNYTIIDPVFNYGPILSSDKLIDMTVGDFNGDGLLEIAGLTAVSTGGLKLNIYTVNPTNLTITLASSLKLTTLPPANLPIQNASIARGRFNSSNHDQLAVGYSSVVGPPELRVIDFDSGSLQPREASAPVTPGALPGTGFIQVKTGKFGFPDNPWDQIVYHSAVPASNGRFVAVVSVNPIDLTLKFNASTSYESSPCGYGIAVGNFDHRQPDPLNSGQTQHNPNSQIALMYGPCDNGAKTMDIYSVDPTSFALNRESSNTLSNLAPDPRVVPPRLTFTATDIQARSLMLGEPTKIHITSTITPSVVIGAPPMHVDFVSPDPVSGLPPVVLNLSAVPNGFNTTYQQDTSSGTTTNTSNKTSWSLGAKESISGWQTLGDPDKGIGEKTKDTFTAAQNYKKASDEIHGTYQAKNFSLSATTGFGDEVSYTDTAFNIWVYPVIGKTTCPSGKTCPPDQEVPLTIQFSAPDKDALIHASQGQGLQWYQPPWEPGNLFSYPANLDQLKTIYPNLSQLTNGVEFITDTSTVTQKTTWAVTQKDGGTTTTDLNFSFENDFSMTGQAGVPAVAVGGSSVTFDVTGSVGLSSLTENTTNLATSTGIQITKPGTFPEFQNYGYSVSPYIMGITQPGGVVDTHPLSADVQTFGLIRAMFTANPLGGADGSYGGWWKQAYNKPDIALNHPSRWDIIPGVPSTPLPSNCRPVMVPRIDCAVLSKRTPLNAWGSTFHQMRGFFISNANHPGPGPQIQRATAGDVLTLQARVYNYSLAPMPAGSKVHVRFYFAPWNDTIAAGDSVLIGGQDVLLDPIPPMSDQVGAPLNWKLAQTTFDTNAYAQTKFGDVEVLFWVVVWAEGADGKMAEMTGHGLTAIPGVLKSLADVPEECQPDTNCYSNNAGVYRQVFHIDKPGANVVPGPLSGPVKLEIDKVTLSATQIQLGEYTDITAMLRTSGDDAKSVTANFYDGDPNQGGKLFEVQNIAHVSQFDPRQIQTSYRAKSCGVHQLFVAIDRGKPTEVVRRIQPVRVACPAALTRQ